MGTPWRWFSKSSSQSERVLAVALAALMVASAALAPLSVGAQIGEESVEEATVALQPYKLQESDAPPGYVVDNQQGYTNEAAAFENTYSSPPDPRPAESFLQPLVASGRVLRLRQELTKTGDPDAVGIRFNIVLFRDAAGAAKGVRDLSLLSYIAESDQISSPLPPIGIGDESARYRVSYVEDGEETRTDALVWRRGRITYLVTVVGSPAAVDGAGALLTGVALKADARATALAPLPETVATSPAYLLDATARLDLYRRFVDRLLPDDAAPGLEPRNVDSIANAELINDAPRNADPPINDLGVILDRLVSRERRILGLYKLFETLEDSGLRFPSMAAGFHLYADAEGAAEAMNASLPEIALRQLEAVSLPRAPQLQEIPPPMSLGDHTRAFRARSVFEDGLEVEVVTIRWRRGAVELFTDAVVPAGGGAAEMARSLAEKQDVAY